MKKKLCLYCHHFEFFVGSPAYSELTPGDEAEFRCNKLDINLSNYSSKDAFIKFIERGIKCEDFEEHITKSANETD